MMNSCLTTDEESSESIDEERHVQKNENIAHTLLYHDEARDTAELAQLRVFSLRLFT